MAAAKTTIFAAERLRRRHAIARRWGRWSVGTRMHVCGCAPRDARRRRPPLAHASSPARVVVPLASFLHPLLSLPSAFSATTRGDVGARGATMRAKGRRAGRWRARGRRRGRASRGAQPPDPAKIVFPALFPSSRHLRRQRRHCAPFFSVTRHNTRRRTHPIRHYKSVRRLVIWRVTEKNGAQWRRCRRRWVRWREDGVAAGGARGQVTWF
jgi:hypothetical protein